MLTALTAMRSPRPMAPSDPLPAEADGKVTSEELFGDLVDAPLPEPRPSSPARPTGPIKVQVAEPGAEVGKAAAAALPEEVAALLDAFSPVSGPGPDGRPPVEPGPEPVPPESAGPEPGGPDAAEPAPRPSHLPSLDLPSLDLLAVAEEALCAPATPRVEVRPAAPVRSWRDATYGPYELLDRVAIGGMAEVFKAKRTGVEGFEKIVAVKRILPHLSDNQEFVDMFVDEAKMVAGLTHPNIVQIFDLGRIETSYYIAMEYVHGRDLRTILRRAKERGLRMPLDLALRIASLVSSALEYAHRKKDDRGRPMEIVHRDVSPQNILLSFEGDVKLTDFGIAKAASKASTTDRGALRGKLLYMSPEQAWGRAMDRRSDLFSLGLVLYEIVTDQKPFVGGGAASELSVLETVRQCRIAPPREANPRIPEELERLLVKALAKDPDERFQDASEMGRSLDRVLRDRPAPSANELARFMELLFDREEREEAVPEDHALGDAAAGSAEMDDLPLEIHSEEETLEEADLPITPDLSVDTLLKRFGIK
jgi:serine/threonine protein kinase